MNNILAHYRANKRIWQIGFAFIACALIHNFPALIVWLPDDAKDALQKTASAVISQGVGFLAFFFVKQFNTSGNGTLDQPYTKPDGTGGSKTVLPVIMAICGLSLSGCATDPNGRTYWDVDTTLKATHAAVEILQGSRKPAGYEQLYDSNGEPVDP